MDNEALKRTLTDLGISQTDLARLVDVTPRGVNLWAAGERAVPGPAAAYLRLLLSLPLNLRQVELARINTKEKSMRNGMYGIWFSVGPRDEQTGHGVLTFEDGLIYGIDIGGVRYDGDYIINQKGEAEVNLKLTYPPNVQAIFGLSNPFEWSITVKTILDPKADSGSCLTQTSLGTSIPTRYAFLRALPQAA
jgi:transcriptional regulator with XRE-family HTH domain